MSLRKGTPGKGSKSRADSFSYTKVQHGLKGGWFGFLAGQPYWCEVHEHTDRDPGTKPCLDWLTGGDILCPRCRPSVVPTCLAYVPVYREEDARPCLVIVHESAADLLADLAYPVRVAVGRVGPHDSVYVRRAAEQVRYTTNLESRKQPCDLTRTLLDIWRIPALEAWLQRNGGRRVAARDDGAAFSPPLQAAAQRYGAPEASEQAADVYDAALRRALETARVSGDGSGTVAPSPNGKHPKKKSE